MPCGCVCGGGTCYTEFKAFNTSSVEPRKKSIFRVMEPPLPRTQRLEYHFDLGAVRQLLHGIGVLRVVLEQDGHLECGCLQGPMRRRESKELNAGQLPQELT